MASREGHTVTGNYRVSGNTLTGFSDSSGRLVTYTRFSPLIEVMMDANRFR